MLHMIAKCYRNPEEANINFGIMNRTYERDLVEYVVCGFKSISKVLKEVTLTDYEFYTDSDKVNQTAYDRIRSDKQKDKQQKYVYIKESRYGELIMNFKVDAVFEGTHIPLKYSVKMLIPIPDKKGYYLMKGNRYLLQYQLTESTTYTTSTALVTKSLMPIKMKKDKLEITDTNGTVYRVNDFKVLVFQKYENVMFFYYATMGWSNTLEYFGLGGYITAVPENDGDPAYTYFKVSNTLFIKVKTTAMTSSYVQTMLGAIMETMTNRLSYEDLENREIWTCKIGAFKQNSSKETQYELGTRYILLFNRMLDEATQLSFSITMHNKRDVYAIIRWMVQNFAELRRKDNLDIMNKRLRGNEYVASMLNETISDKIKRFVNTTANTDKKLIKKYDNLFRYTGREIVNKLHSSGLMRYDDIVNDMDFFKKFKVTQKGPNAAGNKNDSKTISSERRSLHPSQLGKLDINVCGASDPGLSNIITPTCKTNGMYFEGAAAEPESFAYNFKKEMGCIKPDQNIIVIEDPIKFNDLIDTPELCVFVARVGESGAESSDTGDTVSV